MVLKMVWRARDDAVEICIPSGAVGPSVNELVTAYKAQPGAVAAWLGEKFGQQEPSAVEEGSAGIAPQEAVTLITPPRHWPPPLALWRCRGAAPAARVCPVARAPSRCARAGLDTP